MPFIFCKKGRYESMSKIDEKVKLQDIKQCSPQRTKVLVEREFVGTRPFEEVFNELNKEVIEQNIRGRLSSSTE